FELIRDRAITLLDSAGVPSVVLKGAALVATLYPDPVERDLEDLDLLVDPQQVRPAVRALEGGGYVRPGLRELLLFRRDHFHVCLESPEGTSLEVHWALTRPNSPFQLDAAAIARQARWHRPRDGRAFRYPQPEAMLLHLVTQCVQEGFCRLARLVDIDRIVTATPQLDWSALEAAAREGGLVTATSFTLQLAARLLGTPLPERARALRPRALVRFHLALLRPVPTLLDQRRREAYADRQLLELWLAPGVRRRLRLLYGLLHDRFLDAPRGLVLGKLPLRQAYHYLTAALLQATPSGRSQTRFWSSHASSSERL
ncbi:MAG TPA: nucleotidyltransferase family protein, partial [Candidatus Polarisedimenticolaceae bacterium]|nr:nucleotidyltransferase family protein [Candidatus Polarisedimenticolaceae bacterium]